MARTSVPTALSFPSRRVLGSQASSRILIVDADKQYRTFARVLLRNSQHAIDEAGDWESLTSLLSRHRYRVILVDPSLGGMLCHEVGRVIRRRNPQARLLVWSSLPAGVLQPYLQEICAEYVSKQCGRGDLVDLVTPRCSRPASRRSSLTPAPTSLPPDTPLSTPPGSPG